MATPALRLAGRKSRPSRLGPDVFNQPVPSSVRRLALKVGVGFGLRHAYADLGSLGGLGGRPVIFLPNHVCSWDAPVAALATDSLGRDFGLAAAPVVLERWPFLRHLGVFPVRRGAAIETARELRALGRRIDTSPNGALWVFAQGGHVRTGVEAEPERGALVVAGAALRAHVVPVAFHYELFEGRRPIAWVKTMPPLSAATLCEPLGHTLASATDALTADLRDGTGCYRDLLGGGRRTVLLENLPCDRGRLDAALRRANVAPSFEEVTCLRGAALAEAAPRVIAAVSAYAGPLYGALVGRALEKQGGEG